MTVARRRAPRTPEQRQQQALRAMSPGSLNGTVANATPVRLTRATVRATPGASAVSGLVYVNTTAPSSPATGQLWYDTDATC